MSIVQQYIDHINDSITRAQKHDSYIDVDILKVRGFSTGVMRRLVNHLCRLPKKNPVYCEAGAYFGGTACAALNNNHDLTAYIIEDYSQPFGELCVREELEANLEKFKPTTKSVTLFNDDVFKMDLSKIRDKIDVLFYDAVHDQWAQRKAWFTFADKLSDVAIILVDDFSWSSVMMGTREGIEDVSDRLKVEREWTLWDGQPDSPIWHNGLAVFVVSKK